VTTTATARRLDRTLAALADPHRRAIVDLLRATPRSAGDVARALDLAAPAASRHLKALREGGLVEERHPAYDARVRIYSLRGEPMAELAAWLNAAEAAWADQLAAFKAHVELQQEP